MIGGRAFSRPWRSGAANQLPERIKLGAASWSPSPAVYEYRHFLVLIWWIRGRCDPYFIYVLHEEDDVSASVLKSIFHPKLNHKEAFGNLR